MLYFSDEWQKVTITIYGDDNPITAEIKPMTVDQLIEITPYFKFTPNKTNDAETFLFKLQKAVAPFIQNFVRNIDGIMINDKPVEAKQLGTETYLAPLTVELIKRSFNVALIDKESEKNLQ